MAATEPDHTHVVRWALAVLGDTAAGTEIELLRDRPWSRTWLITRAGERFFLKRTGAASHYEAPLTRLLARTSRGLVPAVLGADAAQGWLLTADAGPTVRSLAEQGPSSRSEHLDVTVWETFVGRFARLQRLVAPLSGDLIASGVPDERPKRLPGVLAGLLVAEPELAGLTPGEHDRLANMASSWRADLDLIARLPIPATVQHGDLHDNNVSLGPGDEPVFLDFGDATIAHPFTTLFVPLLMAGRLGTPSDVDRIRDAYLAEFADVGADADLRALLEAVLRLSWLSRATSWHRALVDAPRDHKWGAPVPDTLRSMLACSSPASPG